MEYDYEYVRDASDGIFSNVGDNYVELHFHSSLELLFVERGEKTVYINETRYDLKAGDIAVMLPYDLHRYEKGCGVQTVLVVPKEYFFEYESYFGKKQLLYPVVRDKKLFDRLKHIFKALCKPFGDEYLKRGYCTTLFAELAKSAGVKAADNSGDVTLSRDILKYLEENCEEPISLGDLAVKFGFSRTYMSALFKKLIKTDFCNYLIYLRLKKAAALIASGEKNMATVCFKSGFNSLTSFYRAFKNKYGLPPKQFSIKLSR